MAEEDTVLTLDSRRLQWRFVDGDLVALDTTKGEYLSVNSSGAALWEPLVAGATRQGLVDVLQNRFGLDGKVAGRDVDVFLGELRDLGLLVDQT